MPGYVCSGPGVPHSPRRSGRAHTRSCSQLAPGMYVCMYVYVREYVLRLEANSHARVGWAWAGHTLFASDPQPVRAGKLSIYLAS